MGKVIRTEGVLFVSLALAYDGDSVIFVKEQQGKKSETSR